MGRLSGKILVTGGLGYLGGRIATHLMKVAPELPLKLMSRRSRDQVPSWATDLDLARADLLDESALGTAVDGVDTVIHLAAANEIECQTDPELALEVNGRGTHRLLKACLAAGVKRFVYLSTFHVYGPEAAQPITEQTVTRPVHPYAITHRLAEDLVNWYKHSYGMETLVLRLSNGYGYAADPQVQRWTLVFNDVCRQAAQRGEIRLRSRGTQHRDFVSLTDVGRGVLHFLNLPPGHWGDGLFNFGGQCSLSILQVAQRVAWEYLQSRGKETPVILGEAHDPQSAGPVDYSIDKLTQTGFRLAGNMSDEIRGTFVLCDQLEAPSRSPR